MSNFFKILEALDEHYSNDADPKMIAAIRAGLNIRSDFWDNFMDLCNCPTLPNLLGVNRHVIGRWHSVIREYLKHVEMQDAHEASQKKANLIKTD